MGELINKINKKIVKREIDKSEKEEKIKNKGKLILDATCAPAKLFRMALGTLIIKEKLGISDRETIEQIRENPYLQYFIGLNCYQQEPPLEFSMLVHFRKRIDGELINKINKKIVKREIDKSDKEVKKKDCLQEKGEKIKK